MSKVEHYNIREYDFCLAFAHLSKQSYFLAFSHKPIDQTSDNASRNALMLVDQILNGERHLLLQLFGRQRWIVWNRFTEICPELDRETTIDGSNGNLGHRVDANEEALQEPNAAECFAKIFGEHWNDGLMNNSMQILIRYLQ